jgi:hypothetical protein
VLRSLRVRLGGAQATEDVARGGDAEEAVRAVTREHLVPELFVQRNLPREQVCG